MKNALTINACFKQCLLFSLALFLAGALSAQAEKSKRIEKSFPARDLVDVAHRYGPLTVLPSRDGQVRFEAVLQAKGEESAIQALFEHFQIQAAANSESVSIRTDFGIRNWISNNGSTRLEFNDGVKVKNLKDINVQMTLYVPAVKFLKLNNKYNPIRLQADPGGSVRVELYSSQLEAGNLKGDLELDMKYCKGRAGSFGNGKIILYDTDIALGSGRRVDLNAKYSSVELGATQSLTAESYDNELRLGAVSGPLVLNDKYSDIRLERFQSARLVLYDSDLVSAGGEGIQAKSKYSSFELGKIGALVLEESYDDQITAEEIGSFTAHSKYSSYSIETLRRQFTLNSYDDEVMVEQMTGPLEGITINAKYTDVAIKLPAEQAYFLHANMTYGKLVYPQSKVEPSLQIEKNDRMEFKGKTKSAGEESPKITVVSYDGKITFN